MSTVSLHAPAVVGKATLGEGTCVRQFCAVLSGARIGLGDVIMPGVGIGVGAVVKRDVAAGVTAIGNPARPL